jgi:hypothetical protein
MKNNDDDDDADAAAKEGSIRRRATTTREDDNDVDVIIVMAAFRAVMRGRLLVVYKLGGNFSTTPSFHFFLFGIGPTSFDPYYNQPCSSVVIHLSTLPVCMEVEGHAVVVVGCVVVHRPMLILPSCMKH